jgi:hypothetical protein
MAQYPPSVKTVGIHSFLAVFALGTGSYAGDQDMIAFLKIAHLGAGFFYDAHSFMAQDPSRGHFRHIPF